MSPEIGLSQRSTLELHDVTSPVIFQNNPPSAAAQSDNETKDQIKPMSTAVVLQRYWRLSVSCQQSADNNN
jgi:hypothetical protein